MALQSEMPKLFIYDRTAGHEEDGNLLEAVLYPPLFAADGEAQERIAREVLDMVRPVIVFVLKLGDEIGKSNPSVIHTVEAPYALLHVGKYTLGLRSSLFNPECSALQWLEIMHLIFKTLCDDFETSDKHTTNVLNGDNVDRVKVKAIWSKIYEQVMDYSSSSQLSLPSLLPGSFRPITTILPRVAVLQEAVCARRHVLGALTLYQNQTLFSHNLTSKFIMLLRVLFKSDTPPDLGEPIHLTVNDVTAYKCFIKDNDVLLGKPNNQQGSYAIIHIKGQLSLSLVVEFDTDDRTFCDSWRRPCTRLKDELLHLSKRLENMSSIVLPGPIANQVDSLAVNLVEMTIKATLSGTSNIEILKSALNTAMSTDDEFEEFADKLELVHHSGYTLDVQTNVHGIKLTGKKTLQG